MHLVRKLVTGAMAAGLAATGIIAATPANALVVNSSCGLSSVVSVQYEGGAYCYVWDGNYASGYVGGMNIKNSKYACSYGYYMGYVTDAAGRSYSFGRGQCSAYTGGATLVSITFIGN
ncbi:hypothetical protein ACFWJT_27865 [Streptomyces sp. NPDC127069]|uniref:hypothetical protein n=1 Tax=Streptomyces sp. NPDC127069 TaxID=3347128 RepID=UPI0036462FA1